MSWSLSHQQITALANLANNPDFKKFIAALDEHRTKDLLPELLNVDPVQVPGRIAEAQGRYKLITELIKKIEEAPAKAQKIKRDYMQPL